MSTPTAELPAAIRCSATCAHGDQCSRLAAPYCLGMCQRHRLQCLRWAALAARDDYETGMYEQQIGEAPR